LLVSVEIATDEGRQFLTIGIQYYVAARHAALCGMAPVAGNLFHHGIEMLLKAGLLGAFTAEALKDKFRHKLPKLWTEFKAQAADGRLAQFDGVIAGTALWEEIRYPGFPGGQSLYLSIELLKQSGGGLASTAATHRINVEEQDELFAALVAALSVNPAYLKQTMGSKAAAAYERENRHRIW
jgi:hypothetical protein